MRNRPLAFCALLLAAGLGACGAGAAPGDGPEPPPRDEWRFVVEEHVALWYHGLAIAGVGADPAADVPIYRRGYGADVAAARRRVGGADSPLSRDATALASRLASSGAAAGLQFLPLSFDDWTQLTQAVGLWQQAGGDPNRVTAEAQPVVAFLSNRFPTAAQRSAVVEWVQALDAERSAFFQAWWAQSQPGALAAETEALWRARRPDLLAFLRYTNAMSGIVSLTPALRGEGRMDVGRGVAFAALGGRTGEDARALVGRLVHELAYPIAGDAVRDAVAPARIREIGEDVLVARAAVRAGAMVLQAVAPDLLDVYRDDFLRAAGAEPARNTLAGEFPLPDELLESLESAVRLATAGI